MLYYDRIDINKGTDPGKSNSSEEWIIFHYWLFNDGLKFEDSVWNSSYNLTMLCPNISDISIITVKMLIVVVLFIM